MSRLELNLGPEPTDPITLGGDQGFVAHVALDDWGQPDAPAVVHRILQDAGPWLGHVRVYRPTLWLVARWTLASGAERTRGFFSADGGLKLGSQFPIKHAANEWTATVIEEHPAVHATIEFVIQSGAQRRRAFYRQGEI